MGQPVGSAPSESEVDLSVFRKKIANILDDLYEESAGKKSGAAEKVQTSTLPGVVIRQRVEGDAESSEATPPMTKYTRRMPPGDEGHGRSEEQGGSKTWRVEASGSWMDYNPACDALPCPSLVPGARVIEFEEEKREFVVKKEKFNKEHKGLNWRVSDAEVKLAQEQKLNAQRQEEWTVACAHTNHDLKVARGELVKLRGERDEASQEVMRLTAILKEKEIQADVARRANEEAQARIAELEKTAEVHKAQTKASEMVSQELSEDCKWLINRGISLLADSLMASEELAKYKFISSTT
ncbi:hypothetical protein Hanom_Chr05g00430571 [Helianthus anomalus]